MGIEEPKNGVEKSPCLDLATAKSPFLKGGFEEQVEDSDNEMTNDERLRQKLLSSPTKSTNNELDQHKQRASYGSVDHTKLAMLVGNSQEHKISYPLDLIVKKIQNVVTNLSDDSSDDEFQKDQRTAKEINHALQLEGFKVVEKENGADCEILTYYPNSTDQQIQQPQYSKNQHYYSNHDEIQVLNDENEQSTKCAFKVVSSPPNGILKDEKNLSVKERFKKGHRRAYSVPNANRGDRAVLVVAEDQIEQEGAHKRHVVRYRLHPYKPTPKTNAAVNTFIEQTNFDVFNLPPEDDEFDEVEMDEEEIMAIPGEPPKRTRRHIVKRFWEDKWKGQRFDLLPEWLQDNEFLHSGHRPQLQSFGTCFKSIFSLHTETGNIWTHMYGGIAFIGVAVWFLAQPHTVISWGNKFVFMFFFMGAIACLGFSFAFHTVQCHSPGVGKLFSKLDYSGITMLIVGSFIPWIYYGFYCRTLPMVIYITMIVTLGICALIVSLWDKFAVPKYRILRAGVFAAMGLSSVIPAFHLVGVEGIHWMFENASFHWLLLMGALYLTGAGIYSSRFPERCFPGKFDIFCQSHQLFHLFVVIAAFVHFYGITEAGMKRLEAGSCSEILTQLYATDNYTNFVDHWFRPW